MAQAIGFVLSAIAVVLSGCAGRSVHVVAESSPEALSLQETLTDLLDRDCLPGVFSSRRPVWVAIADRSIMGYYGYGPNILAFVRDDGVIVFVREYVGGPDIEFIAAHELGHYFAGDWVLQFPLYVREGLADLGAAGCVEVEGLDLIRMRLADANELLDLFPGQDGIESVLSMEAPLVQIDLNSAVVFGESSVCDKFNDDRDRPARALGLLLASAAVRQYGWEGLCKRAVEGVRRGGNMLSMRSLLEIEEGRELQWFSQELTTLRSSGFAGWCTRS